MSHAQDEAAHRTKVDRLLNEMRDARSSLEARIIEHAQLEIRIAQARHELHKVEARVREAMLGGEIEET